MATNAGASIVFIPWYWTTFPTICCLFPIVVQQILPFLMKLRLEKKQPPIGRCRFQAYVREGLLKPFESSCPSIPLCLCPIVNGWQTIPCSLLWLCGLLENMRGGDPSFSFSIRPNAVWLPWIYLSDIWETILAKCYSWLIQILLMEVWGYIWMFLITIWCFSSVHTEIHPILDCVDALETLYFTQSNVSTCQFVSSKKKFPI